MNVKYLLLLSITVTGTTSTNIERYRETWHSLDEDTRYILIPSTALFSLGCVMHYRTVSKATQVTGEVLEIVGFSGLAAISLWKIMNTR